MLSRLILSDGDDPSWIATISAAADNTQGTDTFVAVNKVDGSVAVISSVVDGSLKQYIAYFDAKGALQWQKTLIRGSRTYGGALNFDKSGNVYVVGYGLRSAESGETFASGNAYTGTVTKLSPTGSTVWQVELNDNELVYLYGVQVDSSGNVYVGGAVRYEDSVTSYLYPFGYALYKLDSSGALLWQKNVGSGTSNVYFNDIAFDATGNILGAGINTNYSPAKSYIAKYNSSGTFQWQASLNAEVSGSGSSETYSISTDSADNVYISAITSGRSNGEQCLIAKFNSSGTLQWQKYLGGSSNDGFYGIRATADGKVFAAGYTNSSGAGSSDFYIVALDTSGTVLWQRTLGTTGADSARYIDIDERGNLYVVGTTINATTGYPDILIAKLPADGSLTGTYGDFVYQSASLTSGTDTLTTDWSIPSYTTYTNIVTSTTNSLTISSGTLSSTVTTL